MLKEMLAIIILLSRENRTTESLCIEYALSPATLKRLIAEARHMGADIVSVKNDRKSEYQLNNWAECKKRTLRWFELEIERNLRSSK